MNKLHVLVADDDQDFAESLAEVLELRGLEVEIVFNGEEAITRIVSNGIDVLVLDLCMPKKSGLEVYQELQEKGKIIPTIVVTAFKFKEIDALVKLTEMRVNEIMSKPVDPDVSRCNSGTGGETELKSERLR